jgi:uncharacterized protein YhhL (DUF1145 family)
MTLRRVTAGEWLAGFAGVALLVATFLPWYAVAPAAAKHFKSGWTAYAAMPAPTESAWHSLSVVLAFVLVTALLGIALLVVTINERSPAIPTAAAVWTIVFGALTALLVAYRLIDPPGDDHVRWGAWLGLACAAAVPAGAWLALRRDVRP